MLVMTFIFDYYYYHSNFLFGDFKVFGFYVITFKVLGLCQAHMWLITIGLPHCYITIGLNKQNWTGLIYKFS